MVWQCIVFLKFINYLLKTLSYTLSYQYNNLWLGYFFVPLFNCFSVNVYPLKDYLKLANNITNRSWSCFMASLNVESLSTNVLPDETVEICINIWLILSFLFMKVIGWNIAQKISNQIIAKGMQVIFLFNLINQTKLVFFHKHIWQTTRTWDFRFLLLKECKFDRRNYKIVDYEWTQKT